MVAPVRWAELRPDQFTHRVAEMPIGYLPMGLCEPHGHVAAYGLDTIRADWLCDQLASRIGGIVAPTQGYHVHESGFHARWLQDVVGEHDARLAAFPPHLVCHTLVYQLRAFANAGLRLVVVVTGHLGGNERDLSAWSAAFTERFDLPVVVTSDMMVSEFPGDHAGQFEISALMHIRPDLVDLGLLGRRHEEGSGGTLALGDTAGDASAEYGELILGNALDRMEAIVRAAPFGAVRRTPITYAPVETLYADLLATAGSWVCSAPHPGQPAVSTDSQWKPYERPDLVALTAPRAPQNEV